MYDEMSELMELLWPLAQNFSLCPGALEHDVNELNAVGEIYVAAKKPKFLPATRRGCSVHISGSIRSACGLPSL